MNGGKAHAEGMLGTFSEEPCAEDEEEWPRPSRAEPFVWFAGSRADEPCAQTGVVDRRLDDLDDGSPSTQGVAGSYTGQWRAGGTGCPHGVGTMAWDNGVTYSGEWRDGLFHGAGSKLYSRGGGYSGGWRAGRRHGLGTSFYDGKWGHDRWVGRFVDDSAHGEGTMYAAEGGGCAPMTFVRGQPSE